MAAEPQVGDPMYTERITMDPSKADEQIAYFKAEVLPRMQAAPGFRACRNMLERAAGRGNVGVIFSDKDLLDAQLEHADEWKEMAASRGVTLSDLSVREILFSHIV